MNSVPPGYERLQQSGYIDFIGPVYVRDGDEGPEFLLPVRDEHLNGGKVMHGGMLMSFADIVLHGAAQKAANKKRVESVSMNTDFCAAVPAGSGLFAKTKITRQTRTIIFLSCEITAPETSGDKVLLVATGVWKIKEQD